MMAWLLALLLVIGLAGPVSAQSVIVPFAKPPVSVAAGGTGDATLTLNGVLYGNGTGAVLVTAAPPANSVLAVSAGAPSFSATPTVTTLTTTGLLTAGSGLTVSAGAFTVSGIGPHAIGGTTDPNSQLVLKGTKTTGGASDNRALDISTSIQSYAAQSAEGINVRPTITAPTSGIANNYEGIDILLSPVAGVGTVSQIDDLLLRGFAAPAGTGTATNLYISAVPTGATTNLAIWVASGSTQFNSAGPHSFGSNINPSIALQLSGSFTGTVLTRGIDQNQSLTGVAGQTIQGYFLEPTLVEAGSGVHSLIAALDVAPTITNGAATATDAVGVAIETFAAGAGTTNASGLKIVGPPTGATNNYSVWVVSGAVRVGGTVQLGATTPGTALAGSLFYTGVTNANLGTPDNGTLIFCTDCDPPTLVDSTCTSTGTKTGSLAFRVNGVWKCIS